jgi:two-component system, cell cycle sensor histidine kinase and response regulator CckA
VMKVKTKGATNEAMDPLGILSRLPVVAYVRVAEPHGEIIYVSSRIEHLLGLTPDQFAARPPLWDEIVHRDDRKSRRERWLRACNDAGTYACTYRVRGRDDAHVWVRDQATFEIGEEGGQSLAHGVLIEVTPDEATHRHPASAAINSQKWEAMGRLTGGVAHDFNNLLSVIQNYAAFLEASLDPQDARRNDVEEIRRAGDRAGALIRQFLTFSRRDAVRLERVNLNEIVIDIEHLLRSSVGEDVDLTTKLARGLWPTTVDIGLVEQVLANLAVNAREAMPVGGRLTIETFNVSAHESLVFADPGLPRGRYVCLAVSDDGRATSDRGQSRRLAASDAGSRFGPGTDLGLALVEDVMQRFGGRVTVTSHAGKGSTFELLFPAGDGTGTAAEPTTVARPATGSGERILVVEDEGAVRRLIDRILDAANYDVETASAQQALELFEAKGYRADLLLTDVVMPDMSGSELVARLQQLGVAPPTLFMSGHADEMIARHKLPDPDAFLLQKPFVAEELLEAVRAALDAGGLRPEE